MEMVMAMEERSRGMGPEVLPSLLRLAEALLRSRPEALIMEEALTLAAATMEVVQTGMGMEMGRVEAGVVIIIQEVGMGMETTEIPGVEVAEMEAKITKETKIQTLFWPLERSSTGIPGNKTTALLHLLRILQLVKLNQVPETTTQVKAQVTSLQPRIHYRPSLSQARPTIPTLMVNTSSDRRLSLSAALPLQLAGHLWRSPLVPAP
jgi:hypothetical protein